MTPQEHSIQNSSITQIVPSYAFVVNPSSNPQALATSIYFLLLYFQKILIDIQNVAFWVWLLSLSIMHLKNIPFLTCISCLFLLIAQKYSTLWTSCELFIHSGVAERLDYFQFGILNNKPAIYVFTYRSLLGHLF